jgi:4-amino-4-deoxy-L-arabinose transferase-like glycosyltransferase
MRYDKAYTWHYIITLVSALLFIPFLGRVHLFDWDEINFAECAREMLVTGDYSRVQLNFQPFWEKPPLFIWLQALCMKIFGVNEFAARLPDAVCGVVTLNVIYYIGRRIYEHRFALLWVLAYAGSFLPFLYFKSGIIDPWFNLFIFLSIYNLLTWFNDNAPGRLHRQAVFAGLFAGLAVLTKGPVALIIIGITLSVAWLLLKIKLFANLKSLLAFILVTLLTGLSWFLFEIATGHADVVKEFIVYQARLFNTEDSDHGGPFFYHFIVLLFGCFPASLFLLPAHRKAGHDTPYQRYSKKWMLYLFWVVLILFSIVKTKIVHYSSMCYFPLTYLAAYGIYNMLQHGIRLHRAFYLLGAFLIIVSGIAFTALPFVEKAKETIIESQLVKDDFALASLATTVDWAGWEFLTGIFFLAAGSFFLFTFYKKNSARAVTGLFITSLLTVWLLVLSLTPKVEQYSQGPAIEFYENLQGQDCYVETIGFKSYAYMFYTRRQPSHNSPAMLAYIRRNEIEMTKEGHAAAFSFNLLSLGWMLDEKIDKPAYFVVKVNEAAQAQKDHPDLREIYRKGGFAFFKREPQP